MNIHGNKERMEFRMALKLKVLDAIEDSKGKTRLRITQKDIWVIKVLTVIFSIFFIVDKANIRIFLQVLQSGCTLGFIASVLKVIIADSLACFLHICVLVASEVP